MNIQIESKSKTELLAQYKALLIRRLTLRCLNDAELLALAQLTGNTLVTLRYMHHVTEDELNSIRQAVINGGQHHD